MKPNQFIMRLAPDSAPVSCEDSANAEKVQSKPDNKLEFSVLINTEDRKDRERHVLGERLSSFLANQSVR